MKFNEIAICYVNSRPGQALISPEAYHNSSIERAGSYRAQLKVNYGV
jgi:hypothetical protein